MDTEYAQMFDNEFDKDSLREGKLNIRNEFLRKVYLFFYLNLIV
jgi:FtsH-binding integral membrane protein